jgi:glycosyltransferase involved in cell wall biosynthesis
VESNLLFSIIIPTYNRATFIQKTIESVLTQTYSFFEIIVVDDGSTDNTEALLTSTQKDKINYIKINNSERGAARNVGSSQASGDYITFLDSDDILYPDYLKNAAESIALYGNPPFLHLAYEIKDVSGKVLDKIDFLESDKYNFIIKGNPLSCMGIFLRKDVAHQFKFNEDRNLAGSEDWELWLRVISHYGIKTDNRVSGCLINHDSRSVMQASEEKLFKRKELALKYAFQDDMVKEKFGKYYNRIDAFADTYISLHLILAKQNRKSFKFLFKAVRNYPPVLLTRRTAAIFKHLLLKLIN